MQITRTALIIASCMGILFLLTACKKSSHHSLPVQQGKVWDESDVPQTIVLIRHGEKPGCATKDPCSKYYDVNVCPDFCSSKSATASSSHGGGHCNCKKSLAPCGHNRADSLAIWIPRWYPNLKQIFATAIGKGEGCCWGRDPSKSCRPQQTVNPLVRQLPDVPYDKTIPHGCIGELGQRIFNGNFGGDTILISWQHGEIPDIAQSLGADSACGIKWPACNFNWLWELNFSGFNSGRPSYKLSIYSQPPLPCDSYPQTEEQKPWPRH